MKQKGLGGFFEEFLEKEPLFTDKKVLQSNFTPGNIPHRDEEIEQIAQILAPCLKLEKPSNLFIYGKTGTGKTVSMSFISNQISDIAKKKDIPLDIIYLNCKLKKVADTEYRLIAQLLRSFNIPIPSTGLPTQELYQTLYTILDKKEKSVILVLDEIDQLVEKTGDEILYNLTRINAELKNTQVTIVGISNSISFKDYLDPRIRSSLSEEEIIFPPYNALQIQDILKERSAKAFKQESLQDGVIEKCAAYAAREHGDARRALELIRVAGEIAERKNQQQIMIGDIDNAEEKIEKERILDIIKTQPRQHQAALNSILMICSQKKGSIFTGEVYELYREICAKISLRPLTQRRVSDIIGELDMLGIINAKVISKGRYGRTREISLALSSVIEQKIKNILSDELSLS
ncbi:ORC1-type DNA replication protein [Candidatus Woesearchaeota archaeon]|nr:ORC1-type DNA replication protein [Candidatus Woesearchaeota archaeon]